MPGLILGLAGTGWYYLRQSGRGMPSPLLMLAGDFPVEGGSPHQVMQLA